LPYRHCHQHHRHPPKLDSEFASGDQATLLSALLCMANVALVVTIFVQPRLSSLKPARASATTDALASSADKVWVTNDGDVEMMENPMRNRDKYGPPSSSVSVEGTTGGES